MMNMKVESDIWQKQKKSKLLLDYRYRAEDQFWLNRAYGIMLFEQGYLTATEREMIDKGLRDVQDRLTIDDMDSTRGDIYFLYEKALSDTIGADTACKLHMGRSRNDMYFTEYRMNVRKAIWKVFEAVIEVQKQLEASAAENLDTIIPYYTYGQPAQPGTWAHYLLTVHSFLQNDLTRLQNAFKTVNRCPMGSGAGIGSAFVLDRERVAHLLGFDSVIENTLAAISSVDYFLETESAIAILTTTLERFGSDLNTFACADCGVLTGDAHVCEGSSIMPQKRNYLPGANLRTHSYDCYGHLLSSYMSAGAVSLFPVYETYQFFGDFWKNVDNIVDELKIMKDAVAYSAIRRQTAEEKNVLFFTTATAMAEKIAMETGLPFVKAHHVVAAISNSMSAPRAITRKDVQDALCSAGFQMSEAAISAVLEAAKPMESLRAKAVGGTPKPDDTEVLLSSSVQARLEMENWLLQSRDKSKYAYREVMEYDSKR